MPPRKDKQPLGAEVRLQAFLAHSGVASRRAAEELIASGTVFVNGVSVTAPGTKAVVLHAPVANAFVAVALNNDGSAEAVANLLLKALAKE